MRFFRLWAITVLLLACVVLGSACAGANGEQGPKGDTGATGATGAQGLQGIQGIQGVKGDTGDQGPQGIQGLQGLQGIQGVKGDTGLPGIGVEWVGEWDSATLYGKYDGVGYQGSSYISRQPNNTNHLPTDTNWWDLWVERGDAGEQGIQGIQGTPGLPGTPGADGQDGEPGPNLIVAMGSIYDDGSGPTIEHGYNITSCVWNPTASWYEITLTGIDYQYLQYVVSVTSSFSLRAGTSSVYGMLLVRLIDMAGDSVQFPFTFVVLEFP